MSAVDAWLGQQGAASAPQNASAVDAWLGAQATAPASSAAPMSSPASLSAPSRALASAPQPTAQDFAMGGASPSTLTQLGQIASAGAHGIGSMVNNMANFAERHLPFFPADIAARDTAIQAQSDAQWQANASPGQQASAIVAPLLLPIGSTATLGGDAVKGAISLLPKMGNSFGRAIGSLAGNAVNGGLMATGAPVNPNQPVGPQDASHLEWGAGLGAGIPGLFGAGAAGAKALYNAALPAFAPQRFVGQGMVAGIDPEAAAAAAANIRGAPVFVPGSQPRLSQVAGNPYFVQTEKAAANLPPVKTALMMNDIGNNAARWDALNAVAGTPLDLANAQAARDVATTPLYNLAKQQNIPVDAPMTSLLARPAMQSAIKRAETLQGNTSAPPIFQTTSTPGMYRPTQVTTLTGNGAQAIKESLDALLLPENTQKLSGKEIGALNDTRSAYMAWLEGHSPEFTNARQTFAAMSPPINTMQAGQQMTERLGGLGRGMDVNNNPIMTAPGYATALSQALGGQEFGIEPQAQTALENIGRDLQRGTISNSVRTGGSDTAYNLNADGWLARSLYGPTFGGATGLGKGLGALAALATGHPFYAAGILGGGKKLGQMVGGQLQNHLAGFLNDGSTLLPYLDARATAPVNATQQALGGLLQRQVLPAALGGLLRSGLVQSP